MKCLKYYKYRLIFSNFLFYHKKFVPINKNFVFYHKVWGLRRIEEDLLFVKRLYKRLYGYSLNFFQSFSFPLVQSKIKYLRQRAASNFLIPFGHFVSSDKIFFLYFYKSLKLYLKSSFFDDIFVGSPTLLRLHFLDSSYSFVFPELQKYIKLMQLRKSRVLFFDAFSLPYYSEISFSFGSNYYRSFLVSFFRSFS